MAEGLAVDAAQRQRLAAYARAKFGIRDAEVEDLVQETVFELLRTDCVIRRPAGFVFRVFHTRCCLHLGRTTAKRAVTAGLPYRESSTHHDVPETTDRRVLLRQGFSRISPSCRKTLRAYYLEGKSLKETAAELAVSSSGIWNLIARCLRRLRACLEP